MTTALNTGTMLNDRFLKLEPMTRELFHELFRGFQYDPCMFMDKELYERCRKTPYSREATDARYDNRLARKDSATFAVMLDEAVIGEVVLKHIDHEKKQCELGIHLINDSVKSKGYGTKAEKLAIERAFSELELNTVLADCIINNTRSRQIIEKLGFDFIEEKDGFRYYKLEKEKYYADRNNR